MNKREACQFGKRKSIIYEVTEHEAVFTVEEAVVLGILHPESSAKNLFLRDDKKKNYHLLVLREELLVKLKEVQEKLCSRRLSFASEEDLYEKLVGTVR